MLRIERLQNQNISFGAKKDTVKQAIGNPEDFKRPDLFVKTALQNVNNILSTETNREAKETCSNVQLIAKELMENKRKNAAFIADRLVAEAGKILEVLNSKAEIPHNLLH